MELFPVITDAIWRDQLANARNQKNSISEEIKMKLHPQNPTPTKETRTMVTYTKNEPAGEPPYYTCVSNRVVLGDLFQEVDGFYYFLPKLNNGGCWAGYLLSDLAHKLENLNEAWNQKLNGLNVEMGDSHKSPCTSWTPLTPPKK